MSAIITGKLVEEGFDYKAGRNYFFFKGNDGTVLYLDGSSQAKYVSNLIHT